MLKAISKKLFAKKAKEKPRKSRDEIKYEVNVAAKKAVIDYREALINLGDK